MRRKQRNEQKPGILRKIKNLLAAGDREAAWEAWVRHLPRAPAWLAARKEEVFHSRPGYRRATRRRLKRARVLRARQRGKMGSRARIAAYDAMIGRLEDILAI